MTDALRTRSKRAPNNHTEHHADDGGNRDHRQHSAAIEIDPSSRRVNQRKYKLEVPAETLSGAPITRLRTGTFAQPAPRPNMPASMPISVDRTRPTGVR